MPIESKAATTVAMAFAAALLSATASAQAASSSANAQAAGASPAALAQLRHLVGRIAPSEKPGEPWMEMGPPTVCWPNGWCETGTLPPLKL